MSVNWGTVLASVISGVVVSWPGILVTVWLNRRRSQQHIEQLTRQQTARIERLTDRQTRELLGRSSGRDGDPA